MGSYSRKMIFITLIVAVAVPISTAHRRRQRGSNERHLEDTEQYLRDLCSETDRSDVCWNILRSDIHRFDGSDDRDIIDGVIDLAVEKSKVIGDQLNQWYRDSNDDRLKTKYRSCSENYQGIYRNFDMVLRNLDSDDYTNTSDQIQDSEEELDECRREFGSGSIDPCHVGDRNNELGLYLDMVKVALGRFQDSFDEDHH